MANKPILGDKIIMQYDRSVTATPDWALIGCVTDTGLNGSRETIDASSKCGPAQLAGQKTDTANFTVIMDTTPDVNTATFDEVAGLYDTGDIYHFRYLDDEGGAIYYREFNASLTEWDESANKGEALTGTGTLAITGDIIRTLPVS